MDRHDAMRPNILLITADQWRGDMHFAPTPNLDRLAAEGTRFIRHFTPAYPCGPARASLFTGLYPHKHRAIRNGVPLDARHPTLFTEARRAGYRPTLFGYTDITLDPRGKPDGDPDLGDYENICPGIVPDTLLTESAVPWLAHLAARGHDIPAAWRGRDAVFARTGFGQPAIFDAQDSETAFLTDRFLGWLGVADPKPFFAHLSFIAPHPPFAAAAPFHAMVDPRDVPPPIRGPTPATEAAQHRLIAELLATITLENFVPGVSGFSCDADETTIRHVRAIYAGLVCEVDFHLGRVFAALRASGRWENTVIVFTADHGEQLFDHFILGKTGYFDQSAHIPLIIRAPGHPARIVTQFTESIDIMPTLLELAGLTPPRNCDGHSLLPLCAGDDPADWRDAVHWSFDFGDIRHRHMENAFCLPSERCNLQVVRTANMKYVHFAGMAPVLFDLTSDPDELFNRVDDPACQALRLEGLDRLATWRQRHEEQTLTGMLCRDGIFSRV